MITIRQGESVFMDFKFVDPLLTSIPADYTGAWKIKTTDSDLIHSSGIVETNDQRTVFELRIPGSSTNIDKGTYTLLVQVLNPVTGYSDYILDDTLYIK